MREAVTMASSLRRVGISQRQMHLADRDEWRDALDTRLAALVWSLGLCPVPLANAVPDVTAYLDALGIDAVLLSGGDDLGATPQRDAFERALLDEAGRRGIPVLGICRGLQLINDACGGSLVEIEGHVSTRHVLSGEGFDEGRTVNSFHGYGITPETLGAQLEPLAKAPDGSVEAARHRRLPWTGIMWHPEREDSLHPADRTLLLAALSGEHDA
jgi:gamma-glutamyl-gamma-aminobutyrate hydrolase PuuD